MAHSQIPLTTHGDGAGSYGSAGVARVGKCMFTTSEDDPPLLPDPLEGEYDLTPSKAWARRHFLRRQLVFLFRYCIRRDDVLGEYTLSASLGHGEIEDRWLSRSGRAMLRRGGCLL